VSIVPRGIVTHFDGGGGYLSLDTFVEVILMTSAPWPLQCAISQQQSLRGPQHGKRRNHFTNHRLAKRETRNGIIM